MQNRDLEVLAALDLDSEYQNVDDVERSFAGLDRAFASLTPPSRLGVFVVAYLDITRELKRRLAADRAGIGPQRFFRDADWFERYLIEFANRYRIALGGYRKNPKAPDIAEAWRIAFDAAMRGETIVLQDLLLGINAHINNDQPMSLASKGVGIDPEADRLADHNAVNDALEFTTQPVQERLSQRYGSYFDLLDLIGGTFDEKVSNFALRRARQNSWASGTALVLGDKTEIEVQQEAAALARLVLNINRTAPAAVELVQWLESAWVRGAGEIAAVPQPKKLGGINKLIDELTATIDGLDQRHRRLALYATVHRDVLVRSQAALEAQAIEEPKWIVNVQRQCLRLYLNSLEAYLAGRLDQVPASWLICFEAATERDEIVVPQVVALGINTYLVHDIPIALFREEFYRDPDRYRADYAHLVAIIGDAVNAALATVSMRYDRGLPALGLDDAVPWVLGEFDVPAAGAVAWKNAEAFALAGKSGTVREQFRVLDADTSRRAQRMLVPPLLQRKWLAAALREVENGWTDPCSAWVTAAPTVYRKILGSEMEHLAPGLRAFLGQSGARGAAGNVWVARGETLLSGLAYGVGLLSTSEAIGFHLEAVASGAKEHWFQVVGRYAFTAQHSCEDGRLVVGYGPWRFAFRLQQQDGRLQFEQVGVGFLRIPMLFALLPRVEVEAVGNGATIDLQLSLRLPLAGEVLRFGGQLTPQ